MLGRHNGPGTASTARSAAHFGGPRTADRSRGRNRTRQLDISPSESGLASSGPVTKAAATANETGRTTIASA